MNHGRLGPGPADRTDPLEERIARARSSIVGVRAGALSASGWVALPNGVVVTSRRGLGYPTEVTIELESGVEILGRLIAADVARDIAFILPLEILSARPLPLRQALDPRLGEPITALSRLPGESVRLAAGRIIQVRRGEPPTDPRSTWGGRVLGVVGFELDVAAPLGAAVLDAEGRVVGLRVAASRADDPGGAGRAAVLPAGALQTLLASVDRPAVEIRERAPVYRCPSCEEPFDVEADRCISCGRALPHTFAPAPQRAGAERLIRDGLSALGMIANRFRVGPRSWRVVQRLFTTAEATHVELSIDDEGRLLTLRAPVVGLPTVNHEPFYRFLLTMNDQTTGELRVSVAGDLVSVSRVEPIDGRSASDLAMLISELVRVADEYRRTLTDTFEAVPRYEAAGG